MRAVETIVQSVAVAGLMLLYTVRWAVTREAQR